MSRFSEQDDFDLTALRYLAGELSPVETETFELLLAADVTTCERLADVVELTAAMMTATSPTDARPTPGDFAATKAPGRSASFWPLVMAASIVLAIGGGLVTLAPRSDDADTRLAQSWIDSSAAVDDLLADDNLLVAEQSLTPHLEGMQLEGVPLEVIVWDGDDDTTWNAPPAWMMAAVALEQADALDREATTAEVQQ